MDIKVTLSVLVCLSIGICIEGYILTPPKPYVPHMKPWRKPVKPWSKPVKPWSKPVKPWSKPVKPWSKPVKPWSLPKPFCKGKNHYLNCIVLFHSHLR